MPEQYLFPMVTSASFASAVGVSIATLRRWERHGLLPRSIKVSRYQKVFLPSDVRAFLKDNRPFHASPVVLFEHEVDALEAELKTSLKAATSDDAMIPSVLWDSHTGSFNSAAFAFMLEMERKTFRRFRKAA